MPQQSLLPAQPGRGSCLPGYTAAGKAAPRGHFRFSFSPACPFHTASNDLPVIIATEAIETLQPFFPTSTPAEDSWVSRPSLATGFRVTLGTRHSAYASVPSLRSQDSDAAWRPLLTRSGCEGCLARTGSSVRPSPSIAGSDLRCSHYTLP